MSLKIAIAAMKGGVGKTMLSVNIAATLALEYNKSVLFIDTDPQANSTNYFDINEFADGYKSLKDALENNLNPREVVMNTYIDNLKLIGSSMFMTALEFNLFQAIAREFKIKNYIDENKAFFDKFDYIIFDTNPSMSIINQNVFTAVDKIIIATEASTGGAKGVDLFCTLWLGISKQLRINDKIEALILNRMTETTNISKEFKNYLDNGEYKDLVIKSYATESTVFKDAESYKQVVALFRKKSKQHKQIQDIVNELIQKEVL